MSDTQGALARYYELGDQWGLTIYESGDSFVDFQRPCSSGPKPHWLENIVNASRIGDHGVVPAHPPPDYILWFRVDPHTKHLVSFGRD